MLSYITQRRLTLTLLMALPAITLVSLGWFAWRSPYSRFLTSDGAAQWIHYPVPPQTNIVAVKYEQHAHFRRNFELARASERARMRVRAFGDCKVIVNGRPLALPRPAYCNEVRTCDVSEQLHAGTNEIRAVVANTMGPPILWLSLDGPGWRVASDDGWSVSLDGAVECSAHRAGQPQPLRRGNPAAGGNRAAESLWTSLPALLAFALLSALVVLGAPAVVRQRASGRVFGYNPSPLSACLLAALFLWLVLFVHNALWLPQFPIGFDAVRHLVYIQYIQEHQSLPLADEGFEMHHPPLYYLLAAGLLGLCGLTTAAPAALLVLRALGLAIGLAQLALVAGCLRLLFPDQPRCQVIGLVIAAFLPVHIYICHYVTNEALLMALGTAALYVCLYILRDERPSTARHALLGLCLGAALLTKVTGLVVAGVVLLVLAGRLLARCQRQPMVWLRTLGVTLLIAIVVSGWHYARVWAHFGRPLVGNYDAASGFDWWQDPGYATPVDPFYSAFQGLPDGLYSTGWGDGMCGGVGAWRARPPWNYDLMSAGFLLALLPCLAIAVGLVAAVIHLARRPNAEWFLLFGVPGGLTVALVYQFLRYPYYGHAKAFYALSGMVSVCALGAWGLDILARLHRALAALLAILLGTWALTAYASFWIQPDSADTRNWVGTQEKRMKRWLAAEVSFDKAIEANPHSVPARLNAVRVLLAARQNTKAHQLLDEIRRDDPDDPDMLLDLAYVCETEGRINETLEHLRHACAAAPDHEVAYSALGSVLMKQNQTAEAIAAYRQALRVRPSNPADHANLGLLLARTGQIAESLVQYHLALSLRPDHPEWLADLAWILATAKESAIRDPKEALDLAQDACQRSQFRDVLCLQSLAAAYAANDRYSDAVNTLEHASQVVTSTGQENLAQQIKEQKDLYESGKPLFARAPPRFTPYAPVVAASRTKPIDQGN
jgi:tetratricopeptide (TPR) repeat protein